MLFRSFESKLEEAKNTAMRFGEFKLAKELSSKIAREDIILIDGPLDLNNPIAEELIDSLFKSDRTIMGICKTSRMATETGRSLLGYLNQVTKDIDSPWYYKIPNEEGKYIAKLHKGSDYCYRVDMNRFDKEALKLLAFYSSDPVILGYPYPLYRADKVARIRDVEEKRERMKIRKLEKEHPSLKFDVKATSMHEELDKRRGY